MEKEASNWKQIRISYANILTMEVFQFQKILFILRSNILFSIALCGSALDIIINISSLTRVVESHISRAFWWRQI